MIPWMTEGERMSTRTDCTHDWHYNEGGFVESCLATVCGKCGIKSCLCEAERDGQKDKVVLEWDEYLEEKYPGAAWAKRKEGRR